MGAPVLRWYQKEAVDAAWAYWSKGGLHPLVELPTGSGKSLVLAEVSRRLVAKRCRVLVVTHRKELIAQDARAILSLDPALEVGIYSAGAGRREVRTITVGGVQSLYRRPRVLGHIDVVIVDEAHLVPPSGDGQYAKLLAGLREINPDLRVMGLSATPHRLGQGLLTEGDGALFTSIVYRASIRRLVGEGHLAHITSGASSAQIDESALRVRLGEFVAADLELACDVESVTDAVVRDVVASGREHVIAFGVSVAHAAHLRNAFRMAGLASEMVTGETPPGERKSILERFRRGELRTLTGCDVLTTGFDAPLTDCIALVRPTMSPALYVQIVGRGMRPADGKIDCLLLDYGGNVARHGPIDEVRPRSKASRDGGEAPYKVCPDCGAMAPPARRICRECDHEWAAPERKANAGASSLPPLSWDAPKPVDVEPVRYTVDRDEYREHTSRASGMQMLRADYYGPASNLRPVVSEYICLEHDGYARTKAEQWWIAHGGKAPVPTTTEKALERMGELLSVEAVWVKPDGEFQRVTKVELAKHGLAVGLVNQRGACLLAYGANVGAKDRPDDEEQPATKERLDDDFFYEDDLPF